MDDLRNLNAALIEAQEEGARMMAARTARPRGTDKARVIRVIVTESLLGRGTADDPVPARFTSRHRCHHRYYFEYFDAAAAKIVKLLKIVCVFIVICFLFQL